MVGGKPSVTWRLPVSSYGSVEVGKANTKQRVVRSVTCIRLKGCAAHSRLSHQVLLHQWSAQKYTCTLSAYRSRQTAYTHSKPVSKEVLDVYNVKVIRLQMRPEMTEALFRSIDSAAVAIGHNLSAGEPPMYISTPSFNLTVYNAPQTALRGFSLGFNNRTVVEFPADLNLGMMTAESVIVSVGAE